VRDPAARHPDFDANGNLNYYTCRHGAGPWLTFMWLQLRGIDPVAHADANVPAAVETPKEETTKPQVTDTDTGTESYTTSLTDGPSSYDDAHSE